MSSSEKSDTTASSALAVRETLQLLDRLGAAIRECAQRANAINTRFRLRQGEEETGFQEAVAALDEQRSADAQSAASRLETARARAAARFDQRSRRIPHAHNASQKDHLQRIKEAEGNRKYAIQIEKMQMDRALPEDLARADASHETMVATLDDLSLAQGDLEERAERLFRGYRGLLRKARRTSTAAEPQPAQDAHRLVAEINQQLDQAERELAEFQRRPLPWFFRLAPPYAVIALIVLGNLALAGLSSSPRWQIQPTAPIALSLIAMVGGVLFLHHSGKRQARPAALALAHRFNTVRRLCEIALEKAAMRHRQERQRLEHAYATRSAELDREWQEAANEAEARRRAAPGLIDAKLARVTRRSEALFRRQLARIEQAHQHALDRLEQEAAAAKAKATAAHALKSAELQREAQAEWQRLTAEWSARTGAAYAGVSAITSLADTLFPPWPDTSWEQWAAPREFPHAARFARLDVDLEKLSGALPDRTRLPLPGPPQFTLPLCLTYPREGSLLIETYGPAQQQPAGFLNNIILRLLLAAPPGRLTFTIVDPVGLGQNFAGVMHLADYEPTLVNSRIWTQPKQIEDRLADLNEHMEKVIQMYLRDDYASISEYNERAGNIAEKYHFLVVADFPAGFSEIALRRLLSIVNSGARCGVYTLIHWDQRERPPSDIPMQELRRASVCVQAAGRGLALDGGPGAGAALALEAPPPPETANRLLHAIGQASKGSNRVEVPFAYVAPEGAQLWSQRSAAELRVPIGRTGATKRQQFALGDGTRQHALIIGKTGSGKSTLFHVLITNLALWLSPAEVEFYLVDFKKGVEFKCYAAHRLPHARVVAIESDREFGLSVLERVDAELKRRGEAFRKRGVQDIRAYRSAADAEPLPRTVLIVDEFQEFFVEDDRIAQTAALLLDRLVRQGRAFGIHVVLGSQTLGGAYTLSRATLGQMVVRIALQCNEADAFLIMEDNNSAPRLLSRPGEAIYNDASGAIEGNSPFQVVWLPERERDELLQRVRAQADAAGMPDREPIVFEGNMPANVEANRPMRALLEANTIAPAASPRVWLGEPNAIKGPTEVLFHRQSGNNLLIVGQHEEEALAAVALSLVALASQHHLAGIRFLLADSTAPDSRDRAFLDRAAAALPHTVTRVRAHDLAPALDTLAAELTRRGAADESAAEPAIFLFVCGLQRFRALRYEEDFGFSSGQAAAGPAPGAQFNNLLLEGAHLGLHVVATCDTYANASRFLSRRALGEFGVRMLFQMSATDSASLIDSPSAASLGLYRAILYNEQEGYLETFRPYARPSDKWLGTAASHLARLTGKETQ